MRSTNLAMTAAYSPRDMPLLPSVIVGIGGSAGAASALIKVLSHMDQMPVSKLAVIVQLHSAQVHPMHMSQSQPNWLLSEVSNALGDLIKSKDGAPPAMRVEEMPTVHSPIQQGVVYVCEPGCVTSITQIGEIKRTRSDTANTNGISTLLAELSVVQQYALVVQSVGVVLSGMVGADAIEGARELSAAGGTILVQAPESCEFDGMPSAVLGAVPEATIVLPEQVFSTITEMIIPASRDSASGASDEANSVEVQRRICDTVLRERGCDFRLYHSNMVSRRITHCMHSSRSSSLTEYADRLAHEPELVDTLMSKLLINVTSFFRDPDTWALVAKVIIPSVFLNAQSFELRFWVAGCSTGEEAFTLGMLILEHMRHMPSSDRYTIRIFATDIDLQALDYARAGRYPAQASSEIPPDLRARYFSELATGARERERPCETTPRMLPAPAPHPRGPRTFS